MTSTNFQIGFSENAKNSSKVLKPPGGGTSDIFGGESSTDSPRSSKNRMASNIFGETAGPVSKNGDRPRAVVDSHNRLFGEPQRMQTPMRDRMRSNIPIGDAKGMNGHTNGHSGAATPKINGHSINGGSNSSKIVENGVEHTNGTKEPDDSPFLMSSRSTASNASSPKGNPVTGEGYKPAGTEINTSIPCLNGANQVINKNRIPPGGFSSGLW
uniref:Microtubule-associated protein Jupiter n=1 Tax=Nyssomyia neivai TaxID=330878 RepID=A0A1L8E610_9DIPT